MTSSQNVTLAVYDLSHGMARQLGQQFLGFPIDMIPHTGVVVYGKEYFFGGGIQSVSHEQFVSMYMQPVQMIAMGATEISREVFEEFLEDIRPRYTQDTYDLITNNCNNFSDEVIGFLVGKSVPSEITGLPERVFSSPMGQMLRPMIEQTQSQMRGVVPGFSSTQSSSSSTPNPWATSSSSPSPHAPTSTNPWATSSPSPSPPAPTPTNPWATSSPSLSPPAPTPTNPWATSSSSPSPPAPTPTNPWATSSSSPSHPAATPTNPWATSSSSPSTLDSPVSPSNRAAAVDAVIAKAKPLLGLRPLLSNNTSVAAVAIRQLKALGSGEGESGEALLTQGDETVLNRISDSITSAASVPANAFKLLHKVLTSWSDKGVDRAKSDFSALCLLRLLVLQPSAYAYMSADGETRTNCLDAVFRQLKDASIPRLSALRLTVVANLFAHASGEEFVMSRASEVREAAMWHLSRPSDPDSRQMASACLHNLALVLKSYSSELMLGCVSDLVDEGDDVVVLRKTIAAGALLRRFPQAAKVSVKAAGLDSIVAAALVKHFKQNSKEEIKQALRELNRLLST